MKNQFRHECGERVVIRYECAVFGFFSATEVDCENVLKCKEFMIQCSLQKQVKYLLNVSSVLGYLGSIYLGLQKLRATSK